jgi:glutamine cyclotransferase
MLCLVAFLLALVSATYSETNGNQQRKNVTKPIPHKRQSFICGYTSNHEGVSLTLEAGDGPGSRFGHFTVAGSLGTISQGTR